MGNREKERGFGGTGRRREGLGNIVFAWGDRVLGNREKKIGFGESREGLGGNAKNARGFGGSEDNKKRRRQLDHFRRSSSQHTAHFLNKAQEDTKVQNIHHGEI